MKLGNLTLSLEKRIGLTGGEATRISILAILFALFLFSFIFILSGVNPFIAYREIFSYAFFNPFGLPITMSRFIFLALTTYAFIIPFRAGLWNIGMAGQLYAGALGTFAVLYAFGGRSSDANLSPVLLIPLMLAGASASGALVGLVAGDLKGKYNLNEIVVTVILNFIMVCVVSFM